MTGVISVAVVVVVVVVAVAVAPRNLCRFMFLLP